MIALLKLSWTSCESTEDDAAEFFKRQTVKPNVYMITMVCEDAIEKLEKQLIEKEEIIKSLEDERDQLRLELFFGRMAVAEVSADFLTDESKAKNIKKKKINKRKVRYTEDEDTILYEFVYRQIKKGIHMNRLHLHSKNTWEKVHKYAKIDRDGQSMCDRWRKHLQSLTRLNELDDLQEKIKEFLRKAFKDENDSEIDDSSSVSISVKSVGFSYSWWTHGGLMVDSWWTHGGLMVDFCEICWVLILMMDSWWTHGGLVVDSWWTYGGFL
ncbi:hypothetical protein CAEBREN_15117 [Caenorhabditis brenneri]|uniref:Myb-like domain-containing protein n=1 Tax=Caenorhabditis brenneri TaxID=135651 RepID=G0P5L4_CAEBE|nr:hypothetical protein CAEBREN_15117 [Caenorhabditis brenneri]